MLWKMGKLHLLVLWNSLTEPCPTVHPSRCDRQILSVPFVRAHGFSARLWRLHACIYATLQDCETVNHISCGAKTSNILWGEKNLHPVFTLTTQEYKCHSTGNGKSSSSSAVLMFTLSSRRLWGCGVLHEGWTLGQSWRGFLRGGDLLLIWRLVGLHRRAGAHQVLVAVDVVDPWDGWPELGFRPDKGL